MKKPFYKKWWFIVCAALLVIYGLSALTLLGDNEENGEVDKVAAEEKKKETVEEKKVEKESSTIEEKISAYIIDELGKNTNNDKDRIVSVGYIADTFEVVLNADDSLTVNLMKTSMLSNAAKIFEEIQKHKEIKGDVIVGYMIDLVDTYGNKEASKVLSVRLTQEELNKINFENFDYNNFEKIADVYYEHSAIQ